MESLTYYKQKASQAIHARQLIEAEQWLRKARELSSSDADVWQLSVQVNGQLGELQTAATCCEHLLTLKPNDGTTWGFLGTTRLSAGRHHEAIEAFDRALTLSPETPMILINRGCALFQLDKFNESIDSLNRAIQLEPSNANAHFNLARTYKSQGKIAGAIQALKTALQYNPDLFEAHCSLGTLLYENGSLLECKQVWLHALGRHPNQIQYRLGLAKLYTVIGEYDSALEQYRKTQQIQPGNAQALCGQADVLEKNGNFEQAYDTIKTLLAGNIKDVTLADVFGRLCHRFDACEEAVQYFVEMLNEYSADEHLRDLHFSLGYVYDRIGRYDEAFLQFEQANKLCRHHCDMEEFRRRFCDQREYFSKEKILSLPHSSIQSERPIFIVGMPRSGTTLVEQIIASHPEAYGAGELPDIKHMISSMPSLCGEGASPFPQCMDHMDSNKMNRMAQAYLKSIEKCNKNCARIIDKMPHNFFNIGLICLLFPNAKIIHCIRNPADTCLSIFSKSFISLHAYGTDLRTLGQYYREYQQLMTHWHKVFPGRILDINYQDLISDQENYSRELLEYCELEWDDQCLEFYNSGRTVVTASYAQVRQPIYSSSIERWRNYEQHLQPLLQELGLNHS